MPRGSHHDETGVIVRDGAQLVLLRDDGGRWRLDAPQYADEHIGRRARVVGVRSGFDLLDVTSVSPPA